MRPLDTNLSLIHSGPFCEFPLSPLLETAFLGPALVAITTAHTAAWTAEGTYCAFGNTTTSTNLNNKLPVDPLYNHSKANWWFQHDRGCDNASPAENSFLEMPASDSFTVELAHDGVQTSLVNNGAGMSNWPDGQDHPDYMNAPPGESVHDGALHTSNQSHAAGTAFAICY
ncbi:hypothetical protein N7G274_006555 [Stereocaulon virgatum]|uniref:Uncharacterized protein n=1 Tax=Stereocaulon virgatum TaxID=373712 RepID=A0ABR4A6M7_9LECA